MIIDCFTFYNEFDVLEGRLEYLYNDVDYFVLVESNYTHSGMKKPMHFLENMSRYKPYLDKVIYFPFLTDRNKYDYSKMPQHDRDYNNGPWQMENAQRNHITEAMKLFADDSIVIISDLDEIPHKETITIAKNSFNENWKIFAVHQDVFLFNLNQKMEGDYKWHGTVITTADFVKAHGAQYCREQKYNIPVINNGGWHLTYWGDIKAIQSKIRSFSHQELNKAEFLDSEWIKQRVLSGQDLFNIGTSFVPVDHNTLPPDFRNVFAKYHEKIVNSLQ